MVFLLFFVFLLIDFWVNSSKILSQESKIQNKFRFSAPNQTARPIFSLEKIQLDAEAGRDAAAIGPKMKKEVS
jgi:hypothetical protein